MPKASDSIVERVARAIWLTQTVDGWDDGTGVEKRMSTASGLLVSVSDFYEAARAAIAAMRGEPSHG